MHNKRKHNERRLAKAAEKAPGEESLLVGSEIALLSWNIEKGKNKGWLEDLKSMAKGLDLILLQEAVYIEEMKNPQQNKAYWSFSPGYKNKHYKSGLMTVSRLKPEFSCILPTTEPWLGTPKSTLLVQLPIHSSKESLLLVNIHAVNFTFGLKDFRRQLAEIESVLLQHEGPVIVAGDFNTWRPLRLKGLQKMAEKAGLSEVSFKVDERVTKFGHYLDYVFIRELEIKNSRTKTLKSSDHNPLIVKLKLQ